MLYDCKRLPKFLSRNTYTYLHSILEYIFNPIDLLKSTVLYDFIINYVYHHSTCNTANMTIFLKGIF